VTEEKELVSGRKSVKFELVSVANSFLLACVLGGISIYLGVKFNSMLLSVAAPLAIMGTYIYSMLNFHADLPISIIGDSFYYLGFILTLLALVVSLVEMSNADKVNMNNIIGSFGVALMTTIVGLVSRIVVTSFSVQGKERRERLDTEIEHGLTKFSAQLDVLTNHAISSLTKVHSQTEEALLKTSKNYSDVNKEIASYLDEMVKEGSKSINESMENLSGRINNIDVSSDLVTKPLGKSLGGIIETLDEHQKSYNTINSQMVESNNSLSNQFSNSTTVIQKHVDNLESSLAKTLDKQIELYSESISDIGSTIIEQFGDIKDLKVDAQNDIENQLIQFNKKIKSLSDSLESLVSPINDAAENMTAGGKNIAEKFNGLISASNNINDMVDTANNNAEKIILAQGDLGELSGKVSEFSKGLENAISVINISSEKLSSLTDVTESSASQVANDIAEVYKQLANQIKSIKEIG